MQRLTDIAGAALSIAIGSVVLLLIVYNTLALVSTVVNAPLALGGTLLIATVMSIVALRMLARRVHAH